MFFMHCPLRIILISGFFINPFCLPNQFPNGARRPLTTLKHVLTECLQVWGVYQLKLEKMSHKEVCNERNPHQHTPGWMRHKRVCGVWQNSNSNSNSNSDGYTWKHRWAMCQNYKPSKTSDECLDFRNVVRVSNPAGSREYSRLSVYQTVLL